LGLFVECDRVIPLFVEIVFEDTSPIWQHDICYHCLRESWAPLSGDVGVMIVQDPYSHGLANESSVVERWAHNG